MTPCGPSPPPQPADLDLDGRIDVLDVQLRVNVFLGSDTDPEIAARADLNSDGSVGLLDFQRMVNTFLGG